ncbi:MAG TPA: hypothetical protein VHD87_00530, partial [Acidimicrobiales bacterium]|nr:hypothetical protein [Acidimicrobiales bacterium]
MTRRGALLASTVLLAIYLVLSLGNDTRGFLGTDTGGKVATLRAMDAHHNFDPDVGYWAAKWDPSGALHPLYYTSHIGDRWVNVTTLPAVLAADPLYRALGYRGALLLPMLGAVACALAAAALARRLGARDGGRLAFWLVGLASPVAIYALDFWEHTLGLAAMAWATIVLVDVVQRRRAAWFGVGAGVLFGVAATMRTEALAFGAVATAIACLVMVRTRVTAAVVTGACVAAGLAVPLLANQALEHAVLGSSLRSTRAEQTVSDAGSSDSAGRVKEAAITTVGVTSAGDTPSLVFGAAIAAAVALAALRRDARLAFLAAALLLARTA